MRLVNSQPMGQRRVYDIEVDEVHNFYANGVNVHNCTGLPKVTWAVATDGGISVYDVHADAVWKITGFTGSNETVDISGDRLCTLQTNGGYCTGSLLLSANVTRDSWANFYTTATTPVVVGTSAKYLNDIQAVGSVARLTLFKEDLTNTAEGSVAYITSKYNSGWMNGNIKGAFALPTDHATGAGALVGSELVTNGTFDTSISGWTDNSTGSASISWQSGGYMRMTDNSASDSAEARQSIATVVGETYVVSMEVAAGATSGLYFYVGSTAGGIDLLGLTANESKRLGSFVATGTTTYLKVVTSSSGHTSTSDIDNISVRKAIPDVSVNNNAIAVHGALDVSPVATGAELLAVSGFGTSDYLEQPYNADLDFGTGDFYVMGWVKLSSVASRQDFLQVKEPTGEADYILCSMITSTDLRFQVDSGSGAAIANQTTTVPTDVWFFYCGARTPDGVSLYIDGVLVELTAQASSSESFDFTTGDMSIGSSVGGSNPASNSSLANWRIGAGAPSAEEIKRIYNSEKHLFQENAACTLAGTSDAITALGYDKVTQELHAGTSGGRSVFNGLVRVAEDTSATSQSLVDIAAKDGMLLEGK